VPLDPLFEEYIAAQRRRRRSPLTLKAVEHALRTAQRWLDIEQIAPTELSLLQCERYFDALLERNAVSTVRRHLAYLRAAYSYAVRHELVHRDPTAEVRLPRLPDHEPVTYSNEQLRSIYAAIRTERERTAFFLLAFAGLRLGEAARLRWRDVDFEHRQLRVNGKSDKQRLVPLHPQLHHVLGEDSTHSHKGQTVIVSISGRPLEPVTLGRAVRALVDRAGIEIDAPSHAFRRTLATTLYEEGVRTRVIERIMGWAPRRMYERHYLRVADTAMREAILNIYRDDPICGTRARRIPRGRAHARELETAAGVRT
jgi:site-specific recombinase XerD